MLNKNYISVIYIKIYHGHMLNTFILWGSREVLPDDVNMYLGHQYMIIYCGSPYDR